MKTDLFQFGTMVFNDEVMQERLPKDAYESLRRSIDEGVKLDSSVANIVANAMKDWAIDKGATHYCHWFMPMTNGTSEKHDAFLSLSDYGKPIYEFSGKNLIKGESDASSFPSGGLRATCEARGYTTWDCTSPAFIREGSLYIPTAFCSYTGEALDKKTPLLRSADAISRAAIRMLDALGIKGVKRVFSMVGAEQEYFLVDKEFSEKRMDLMFAGRTVIGKKPPKGQELADHYFGSLHPRVAAFMRELDSELWKLGVGAKTKHNEAAPAQHELAPIFSVCNVAADENYLTMDIMRKVALKHGLVCLLHEKPFSGMSGSGKHNNWSLCTDSGLNLLDTGRQPEKNAVFLLTLAAVVAAVDKNAELILMSAAGAGNDLRLGAYEAPPNILSVYLGDGIMRMLESMKSGKFEDNQDAIMNVGISSLLDFAKDNSDRNRTSPFAFTGNKFEFRMIGSSASIAEPTALLNSIVAAEMNAIADSLEGSRSKKADALTLAREIITAHERIIFNGNNYADEWTEEAERRGLPRVKSTVDGLEVLINREKTSVLIETGTYTQSELNSRYGILMENYVKTLNVEARTLVEMVGRQIIPAVEAYIKEMADCLEKTNSATGEKPYFLQAKLKKIVDIANELSTQVDRQKEYNEQCERIPLSDILRKAIAYRDMVLPQMERVRNACDELEELLPDDLWPIPSYVDLLFRK